MNKILYVIAIALTIFSCASSTSLLQHGDYDRAIDVSVKKLIKKPSKSKEIDILDRAFHLANDYDNDAIKTLKSSGRNDQWDKILNHLYNLRDRQNVVKRVPSRVLQKIRFREVDYNEAISVARHNVAEYFYAHGTKLLLKKDKKSARQAYDEFYKVKRLFPDYKDIDQRMQDAEAMGVCQVLFEMQNSTDKIIPKGFEVALLNVTLKNLNKKWINFDTKERKNLFYDYTILLSLKNIEVSPEHVRTKEYEESKEVDDGFQYVLDENGNVKKDTSGNDIKIPKTKFIKAYVKETILAKSAIVRGTIDIYDNRSDQLIKTETITFRSDFLHSWARANGNLKALKPQTRRKLKYRRIPFPSDLQMIYDTNEDLKKVTKYYISRYRNMLINR